MLNFERDRLKENDDFVIAIYWIGYSISEELLKMMPSLEERFQLAGMLDNNASDSEIHRHFELDVYGQPLCINEFATWLAHDPNTHVIQFDDKFLVPIEHGKFMKYIQFKDVLDEELEVKLSKIGSLTKRTSYMNDK